MGRQKSEEYKDDEDEGFVRFRKRHFEHKFLLDAWSNGYVSGRKNLYFSHPHLYFIQFQDESFTRKKLKI